MRYLIRTHSWEEAVQLAKLVQDRLQVTARPAVVREGVFATDVLSHLDYVRKSSELLLEELRNPPLFEAPFRPVGSTNCIKLLRKTSDGKQLWLGPGDQYYVEDEEGFLTAITLPFQKPSRR